MEGGANMKNISVIGVPMDLGQSRRGVDMGPSAIRYAGAIERLQALNYHINDLGDIAINRPAQSNPDDGSNLKNLQQVIEANDKLAEMVNQEVSKNHFPLVFGGDHSISIGSLDRKSTRLNSSHVATSYAVFCLK